ncbi:MAG TPA: hypothetical protein GX004_08220 [Firmicutes bacterium]|nr:hypothetical protein [Bacillota bacterium]
MFTRKNQACRKKGLVKMFYFTNQTAGLILTAGLTSKNSGKTAGYVETACRSAKVAGRVRDARC